MATRWIFIRYPGGIAGTGVVVGLAVGLAVAPRVGLGDGDAVTAVTTDGGGAGRRADPTPTINTSPRHSARTLRAGVKRLTGILEAQ